MFLLIHEIICIGYRLFKNAIHGINVHINKQNNNDKLDID